MFFLLTFAAAKVQQKNDICKKNVNKWHFITKTKGRNLEIWKKYCIFAQNLETETLKKGEEIA